MTTHRETSGGILTAEYRTWCGMLSRCQSPSRVGIGYQERGIKVCERWRGVDGFSNFLEDMGRKPSNSHSLDRIDNNGNYEPGNCRWATVKTQARNRRSNVCISIGDCTKTLVEWSAHFGVHYSVVKDRIRKGWSIDDALQRPVRPSVKIDTGTVFGDWTVLKDDGRNPYGQLMLQCRCVCGTIKQANSNDLLNGKSTKCRSCSLRGNERARKISVFKCGQPASR